MVRTTSTMPKKKNNTGQEKAARPVLIDRETSSFTMVTTMASENLSPFPTKKRTLKTAMDQVRRQSPSSPKDRLFLALQQSTTLEKSMYLNERLSKKVTEQLTPQDVRDLRVVFDVFDVDKSGFIENNELRRACKILGFNVRKQDIDKMMADVDTDKSSKIDFNEFLEFVISRQGDERDIYSEIMQGFRLFDRDGSGTITFEDLKSATKETGVQLNDLDLKGMIYEADRDGDNEINEEEFVSIMLKTNLFF